jgi:hypothetical protein
MKIYMWKYGAQNLDVKKLKKKDVIGECISGFF